jgi:hypothetical protein
LETNWGSSSFKDKGPVIPRARLDDKSARANVKKAAKFQAKNRAETSTPRLPTVAIGRSGRGRR